MNETQFWNIIGLLNWRYEKKSYDKVIKPVIKKLAKLDDKDIFEFHNILAQLLYDLDSKAIFKNNDFDSGDNFLYSRCAAVVNGKEFYDNIKYEKAELDPCLEFEPILYVAQYAWEKKHKKSADDYPHIPNVSYETGSNKKLWQ